MTSTWLEFELPLLVLAKQGDKSSIRKMRDGRMWIHHYTKSSITKNATAIGEMALQYAPAQKLEGPIAAEIIVVVPWRKQERKSVIERGLAFKDTVPDHDNFAKQVCDALEKTERFFANDSQIAWSTVLKVWGPEAKLIVRLRELDNNDLVVAEKAVVIRQSDDKRWVSTGTHLPDDTRQPASTPTGSDRRTGDI